MGRVEWGIMGLIDLDEVEVTPEDIEKIVRTLPQKYVENLRAEGWSDRDIAAFEIAN